MFLSELLELLFASIGAIVDARETGPIGTRKLNEHQARLKSMLSAQ